MSRSWTPRRLATPLILAAASLFVAFWQRPHLAFSDARVELAADPSLFLSRALSLWNSTFDLGSIQSSQFVGYAFPMGPFFSTGRALDLPVWVTQRLWLALLLFLAAWGASHVVRVFFREARPGAGTVAGLLLVANPYVFVVLNRGSAWLLAYAALPWLLVWVRLGTREPRGWLYPAAFALTFAASGAGTNAAVVFWPLAACALLLAALALSSGPRRPWSFTWRTAACTLPLALWWMVPVLAQARYGTDYLTFTEHAETILNTSSASESIRLLGYWVAYINGYPEATPLIPSVTSYLLSAPTVLATFLVPAAAIISAAFLRNRRPAAFFALLIALGVLAMSTGFPADGFPGRGIVNLYYQSGPLQFLRTTYKAAPVVALGSAVLLGAGAASTFAALRGMKIQLARRTIRNAWLWVPVAATALLVLVLWGRPIWQGNAVDERLFFGEVPAAWTEAIDDSRQKTPPDTRIAVLPGDLFGWYSWGGTLTSVAPGLSERPVLVRQVLRAAPPNSAQLLESVDAAVQQDRLVPGQLPPLLRLMGVGRVLVGSDSSTVRGEALDAARASRVLASQPGFRRPADTYGPTLTVVPPGDRSGPAVQLPQVRAYDAPRPAEPRITRVQPSSGAQIIDGDANGLVAVAAVGTLNPNRASFLAGAMDGGATGRLLTDSPTLTFTDSNRRRYLLGTRVTANVGPTLTAGEPINRIFPSYDPFPEWGESGRTVAVYGGIARVTSPATPSFSLFPEHRPFAAIDGDPQTTWIAQSEKPSDRYLEIRMRRPVQARKIFVKPHMDPVAATRAIGVSTNGRAERLHLVRSGWNAIPLDPGPVTELKVRAIARKTILGLSPAGIDEIRIPGVRATEALRLPTLLARRTATANLERVPMQVVLERATADFPRRSGEAAGAAFSLNQADMVDSESGMRRIVTLPAGRSFTPSGWASVRPAAPDDAIDRLAGVSGDTRVLSSSRYEGLASFRASSAFDGKAHTGWAAEMTQLQQPWIRVERTQAFTVSRLRLRPLRGRYLTPTRAFVGAPGGGFTARIGPDGTVALPRPLTARSLTIRILSVKREPKAPRGRRNPRAIGIAEVEAASIPRVTVPRTGRFASECGVLSVESRGSRAPMRATGTLQELDNGTALRLSPCGRPASLGKGPNGLNVPAGAVFAPDFIRLRGPAPSPAPVTTASSRVTPSGLVRLDGSGWLVLAQSYSPGWKAWCRDSTGSEKELGKPVEIDGFANGWRIDGSSCRSARFAFGPQAGANVAYLASLVSALVLLAVLFVAIRRRRRTRKARRPERDSSPGDECLVLRVASESRLVSLEREGDAAGPGGGTTVAVGRLLATASSALVAITGLVYVAAGATEANGVNFEFARQHLAGHWLVLAAMFLLLGGAACLGLGGREPERDE